MNYKTIKLQHADAQAWCYIEKIQYLLKNILLMENRTIIYMKKIIIYGLQSPVILCDDKLSTPSEIHINH
jgi:hypothetical protein